jgi:GH15 family glucan-1,4-alpha-glucosidase
VESRACLVFTRGEAGCTHERYIEAKQAGLNVLEEWNPKGYPVYRVWEDPVIDASLLGLSVPFDLLPADDERMVQTAEAVAKHLSTSPAGGIKRYEDDHYIGGNPWILTTLWLAMYYVKQGEPERALPWFEWAVAHHTELGLLPEQIDRNTGETAWVVPLTWSHAMYVLALLDLIEAGAIASEAVSEPGY